MPEAYCFRCGRELSNYARVGIGCGHCHDQEFDFEQIACVGVYRDLVRDMILKFKFSDKTALAGPLSEFVCMAFDQLSSAREVDYLVPVPLHWRRRWTRGYNQAALIAGNIARGPVKVNSDLVRVRNTAAQAKLSQAGRKKNVKDAFAVRRGHEFNGKTVCLVDDIKTSGATLNECARVLKIAGAEKVFALVIAVAGQGGDNV